MMDKCDLRRHYRSLREGLSAEEVDAASAAICRRLADSDLIAGLQSPYILTYLAFRNEPDLKALFGLVNLTTPATWVVPRIEGDRLVIHAYDPTRLERHPFGMLEPAIDLPVLEPGALDLVLVPGVAFDRQGGRLGFGGGFYDRLLPTTPALRVGVTYDACLADRLPTDEHDQRMDWVVTESEMIEVEKQASRR